jgi:dCMP deaminase
MTENLKQSQKKSPRQVAKRDEKYMSLAFCIAYLFSKDPDTQVGAVLVGPNNMPRGWGFNGPPRNINDDDVNWNRPFKYSKIIHAEINAIRHSFLSAGEDLGNATMYVTAPPCEKCMLEMAMWGIGKVVYFASTPKEGSSINKESFEKVQEIAIMSKIKLEKFTGKLKNVLTDNDSS